MYIRHCLLQQRGKYGVGVTQQQRHYYCSSNLYYTISQITSNMLCASAGGKDSCQVTPASQPLEPRQIAAGIHCYNPRATPVVLL